MQKLNLVALFGGQSSEHVVSCMSAKNIIANIDTEKYNVILVGITEAGHWLKVDSLAQLEDDSWRESHVSAVLSPDAEDKCLLVMDGDKTEKIHVDVVFPILHGLYGEDGTVQGILELAKIPYVGCGVLASSAAMDKLTTKIIVNSLGFRQAAYVAVMKHELKDMETVTARVESAFPYPVFIKPSNAGSSRGVTRAENRKELEEGLLHDSVTDEIASRYLSVLKEKYIDTLVLGCTHYPLIRSTLGRLMGDGVTLVNPAYETAVQLKTLLHSMEMSCDTGRELPLEEKYQFYVSDMAEKFRDFATAILPDEVKKTVQINIEEY